MILNRMIFPCGNKIEFTVSHNENENKYVLEDNERYYIVISEASTQFRVLQREESNTNHFSFETDLSYGDYVFEIGIIDGKGNMRVILPAVDERLRPLNQLLLLRRMTNE